MIKMGVELEAKFLVPRLFSKHTGFNFLDWRRVHGLEWSLEKRVTFPLQKGAGLGGGILQRLVCDFRKLWNLSGPWFPYLKSGNDNSSPTSSFED